MTRSSIRQRMSLRHHMIAARQRRFFARLPEAAVTRDTGDDG